MFVFLNHHHTSAFTQNKTVTVFVPRARCCCGVVVACRQGAHGCKAAQAQWRNGGFRAACHHHVGVAIFNHAAGFTNAMKACGASGDNSQIRALETKTHRHMASNHVDDRSWHKEWRNAARAARCVLDMRLLNHGQTANARTNHASDACGQLIVQGFTRGQASIYYSLRGCGNAVMDKGIHRARLFGADVLLQIETLHLACNSAGESGGVKFGDQTNARLAC